MAKNLFILFCASVLAFSVSTAVFAQEGSKNEEAKETRFAGGARAVR